MATKVSEASITCSICLGRFKRPRILPCVHSYCEECLVTYAPPGTSSMKCPLCKDEIEIPNGDVTKFKLDFRLQGQVDDATNYEKIALGVSPTLACNCCDDDQEATSRCLDCEQFLCDFGAKSHKKLSSLRDHNVYPLEELRCGRIKIKSQGIQKRCERHADEKARYYCHTCHDFICRECVVLDHPRPHHEYTSAAEAAKIYKEVVSKKLPALASVRDQYKESERFAANKVKDVENESIAAIEQLEEEVAKLKVQIDQEKEQILEDISKVTSKRNEKLKNYITNYRCIHDRASHVYETTKQLLETGTDNEFLSVYPTLNTKVDQLSREKPEKVQMDGAYMTYIPAVDMNLEMGKLHVMASNKWGLKQTIGSDGVAPGQFKFACAVAQTKDGDFVVADNSNSRVCIFSTEGMHKLSLSTKDENRKNMFKPTDLDLTPDGLIIVVGLTDEVKIFKVNGDFVQKFRAGDTDDVGYQCHCVKVLSGRNCENIGITYTARNPVVLTIHRISDGKLTKAVALPFSPSALANMDDNHVIISQSNQGRVVVFNIVDKRVVLRIDIQRYQMYKYATRVCYDPHCRLVYVASFVNGEQGKGVILQCTKNGMVLGCVAEGLFNPLGICLLGRNELAIADKLSVKVFQKE